MRISRRNLLAAGGTTAMIAMTGSVPWSSAQSPAAPTSPDLIVHNAKVTTLQSDRPEAEAFAVRGERIVAVGSEAEMIRLRTDNTRMIDAGGRRVIPGLNDSHFHLVRGARDYNLELRWDGVELLQRGLQNHSRCSPQNSYPRLAQRGPQWLHSVAINDSCNGLAVEEILSEHTVMIIHEILGKERP
jgi:predicted amidohydrolase YtcJ